VETPAPTPLGHDVHVIDTAMSGYAGITSAYAILSSRPCLVETGTATSARTVIDGLASLGIGPDELTTIVVTHIHLDHAGGVGDLAEAFPRAQVVVHEAGARHLVDPERLLASARRVFGPTMDLFGDLRPTSAARISALGATGSIDLGDGRTLEAFHAPGHARHHLGLLDSLSGDLYVGDAAGIYIPETADLRPATPPPDFDLELAVGSIHQFRARDPNRLLFSHYGPVHEVDQTLARSEEELRLWVDLVRGAHADGLDLDHAVARVRDATLDRYAAYLADPALVERFAHLNSDTSNVLGILRWLDTVDAAGG
jgi:glyoxylase-like metal-dependent hydrolase (beta-lactamase superfamily II)